MATSIGRIANARQRFCAIRIHVHSATRATIRAHAVNCSTSSVRVDLRVSARRLFTTLPKTTVLSCTAYPSLQAQARSAQSGFALRSSLRVGVQRFSTEAAPAEPPTPTLPEPFLVKHAGPLLLTPLAILAVIVAFLLLVPLFSEREYVTLVSQTFERGACVSADSTNVPITTLAPYAESIESIIRSNDGPNFRRTFWVLSASDAAELSSLLRSLCTAHPTGVVYLKITNTTTFARELGHTFSFVFQDEDSGTYSTIRRVFTGAPPLDHAFYSAHLIALIFRRIRHCRASILDEELLLGTKERRRCFQRLHRACSSPGHRWL